MGVRVAGGVGVGVVVRVTVAVGVTVGVGVGQGVNVTLGEGVTVGVPGRTVMVKVLVVVAFRWSITLSLYIVVTEGHSSLLPVPLTPRPS